MNSFELKSRISRFANLGDNWNRDGGLAPYRNAVDVSNWIVDSYILADDCFVSPLVSGGLCFEFSIPEMNHCVILDIHGVSYNSKGVDYASYLIWDTITDEDLEEGKLKNREKLSKFLDRFFSRK